MSEYHRWLDSSRRRVNKIVCFDIVFSCIVLLRFSFLFSPGFHFFSLCFDLTVSVSFVAWKTQTLRTNRCYSFSSLYSSLFVFFFPCWSFPLSSFDGSSQHRVVRFSVVCFRNHHSEKWNVRKAVGGSALDPVSLSRYTCILFRLFFFLIIFPLIEMIWLWHLDFHAV